MAKQDRWSPQPSPTSYSYVGGIFNNSEATIWRRKEKKEAQKPPAPLLLWVAPKEPQAMFFPPRQKQKKREKKKTKRNTYSWGLLGDILGNYLTLHTLLFLSFPYRLDNNSPSCRTNLFFPSISSGSSLSSSFSCWRSPSSDAVCLSTYPTIRKLLHHPSFIRQGIGINPLPSLAFQFISPSKTHLPF